MIILIAICVFVILRTGIVFAGIWKNRCSANSISPKRTSVKSMFVLGSGGHTFEMLSLVRSLRAEYYTSRIYIIADTDAISEEKVLSLEAKKWLNKTDFTVERLPRSREVNQSWVSTVLSTSVASLSAIPLLFKHKPDLLLVNGPGTCIPICGAAILLSLLCVKKVTLVFVESFCRVESMSLTGKILYPFADHFLVQWPNLNKKYSSTKCLGVLV